MLGVNSGQSVRVLLIIIPAPEEQGFRFLFFNTYSYYLLGTQNALSESRNIKPNHAFERIPGRCYRLRY